MQSKNSTNILAKPLELPCGVVLKNRLTKSPMSDSLADGGGNPTQTQIRLYERWAEGGVALSIVGEVQGDSRYPERPGNLVIEVHSNDQLLKSLTSKATKNGAQLWAQLSHAGALSFQPISQPKGPSALNIEGLKCLEMSTKDIQGLPMMYAQTALHAKSVGFGGVQIHASHGFLLSQFLSPLFNHRKDAYGERVQASSSILSALLELLLDHHILLVSE